MRSLLAVSAEAARQGWALGPSLLSTETAQRAVVLRLAADDSRTGRRSKAVAAAGVSACGDLAAGSPRRRHDDVRLLTELRGGRVLRLPESVAATRVAELVQALETGAEP